LQTIKNLRNEIKLISLIIFAQAKEKKEKKAIHKRIYHLVIVIQVFSRSLSTQLLKKLEKEQVLIMWVANFDIGNVLSYRLRT